MSALEIGAIVAALVAAAVPFLVEAVFLLRADAAQLAATAPDDGYYYMEVAHRAAGGEGFTFDGINATSGFHPLWQWILTGLNLIVPGETAFVQATRLLSLALVAVAFGLTARVIWKAAGPLPALAALVIASRQATTFTDLTNGMETPVVLLCLALLLTVLVRYFRALSARMAFLIGLVCAALVLARLDVVLVVPIVGIALALQTRRLRPVFEWAAGGMVIGVPYAV